MKKFQKIFICAGIIVIAVSIVIIVIDFFNDTKNSYEYALENDAYKNISEFWFWCFLGNIFIKGPLILSEISLIKNGYIFLINEQTKLKKIRCLISSVLAIVVLVLLYISENRKYMYHMRQNYIIIAWSVLMMSFVVGKMKTGKPEIK